MVYNSISCNEMPWNTVIVSYVLTVFILKINLIIILHPWMLLFLILRINIFGGEYMYYYLFLRLIPRLYCGPTRDDALNLHYYLRMLTHVKLKLFHQMVFDTICIHLSPSLSLVTVGPEYWDINLDSYHR